MLRRTMAIRLCTGPRLRCGGIPPYSVLTGGKLTAMLLVSPEIALAYSRKYSDAESIIASSIAGRANSPGVASGFLGNYFSVWNGTEPNQYTRVSVPCEILGGEVGENLRYSPLGRTEGY